MPACGAVYNGVGPGNLILRGAYDGRSPVPTSLCRGWIGMGSSPVPPLTVDEVLGVGAEWVMSTYWMRPLESSSRRITRLRSFITQTSSILNYLPDRIPI